MPYRVTVASKASWCPPAHYQALRPHQRQALTRALVVRAGNGPARSTVRPVIFRPMVANRAGCHSESLALAFPSLCLAFEATATGNRILRFRAGPTGESLCCRGRFTALTRFKHTYRLARTYTPRAGAPVSANLGAGVCGRECYIEQSVGLPSSAIASVAHQWTRWCAWATYTAYD